jgi:magnesium chelatase family protein
MALARTRAVALVGVRGHLVEVEADLAQGLPGLTLIGLPDASLAEARDRMRAAVVNSGEAWPQRRITLGLSPASLPKRGSGYDLPMAAAVLAAAGRVPEAAVRARVLLGELGLDGSVRPLRGVLPAVLAAAAGGAKRVVVPAGNLTEARLVPDVAVEGVESLRDLLTLLRGQPRSGAGGSAGAAAPAAPTWGVDLAGGPLHPGGPLPDLADVLGQVIGRRMLEIAAAGAHHLLLLGPPGAGKTMLVERLPGLLPDLPLEEALETSAVHSVVGTLPPGRPLLTRPPFRDPHHTSSVAALVGGGSGIARPGELSLAHESVHEEPLTEEGAARCCDPAASRWLSVRPRQQSGQTRHPEYARDSPPREAQGA